jgi:predicted alpha/beta-hydrolase family hydrolase
VALTEAAATGYAGEGEADALLVLAHGAGAGQRHPFMTSMAQGLAARGIDVVTFDFPYMARKRGAPDKAPVLEAAFRTAVDAAREWSRAPRLFIGGKSMGGRIATHLGAQPPHAAGGIVVFGYPLHPPGKPEQLRVAHFPSITLPMLVFQGERDAFGTPDELTAHAEAIPSRVTVHAIAGGDHSFAVPKRRKEEVLGELVERAADWILSLRPET